MKQTKQSMHIVMRDTGYELFSNGSQASYNQDGRATLKLGMIEDQLPDLLTISDARSLPSPVCASAEPAPFGAELKWEWPKEADDTWHASVRASWSNGEDDIQQGKRICFPDSSYTISGVPSGKKIAASITLRNGNGQRSQPAELTTKSSDDAAKILDGMFTIKNGQAFIKDAAGITRAKVCGFDEHNPFTLADCKKRFGDSEPIPFGGFPMPKRKVRINIAGLQQWKNGIVSGAEVRVDIIQNGKCIHSEVFSGKATQPFTREVEINASFDDIVAVHNRPDLNELKVSAEFAGVTCNEESAAKRLTNIMSEHIRKVLIKETQPGGLLHKR